MLSKRILIAGLIAYGAWRYALKTAIAGYNLTYGVRNVHFVGYDTNNLVFDIALEIANPLPFDTFIHFADLEFAFNGNLLAKIRQHLNSPVYGRTKTVTAVRLFVDKSFFEKHFAKFILSGNYANFVINIKGRVSIDKLNNVPLNINLTLYDFLKGYAESRK